MRVVVAFASFSRHISGVQRHAISVARCLLTRSEISEVHLIAAPWQLEFVRDAASCSDERLHVHTAEIGSGVVSRNLWYYVELPRIAAELRADIVHIAYPSPLRRGAFRCPTVVSLHDLYPYDIPENFGRPKVLFNQFVLRQCLRSADAIACVSESTLSRLEQIEPSLASGKATVVSNSVEPHRQVSSHSPLSGWQGQPFLLCIAQHRRNKNILFLLRVFKRLLHSSQIDPETRLVIVGIEGPETKDILQFLDQAGVASRVTLLRGISEEELHWCYQNCELLLAPSIIEGFGLPVAEALLAGCRVICSDIPAFREVGRDNCQYISLDSAAEQKFVNAVLAAFRQPRCEPVPLPQLSAPVIAGEYLRLYQSLLARASTAQAPTLRSPIPTSHEPSRAGGD
jgi:glycosyltransferase involved in cell wall biosynthesis